MYKFQPSLILTLSKIVSVLGTSITRIDWDPQCTNQTMYYVTLIGSLMPAIVNNVKRTIP